MTTPVTTNVLLIVSRTFTSGLLESSSSPIAPIGPGKLLIYGSGLEPQQGFILAPLLL